VPNENLNSAFAAFLDRLAATKGQVGSVDWDRYILTHYPDEQVEEMRRTIVRLASSWAGRDWPEFNCELVSGWAKRIRESA
jgi:hypothetical protein